MNRLVASTLIGALAPLMFAGCGATTTPTGEQPPQIPPLESFEMNLDEFPTQADSSKLMDPTRMQTYTAHTGTGLQIAFWQTVVAVNLVIPVAALAESFDHTPTRQDDGTWVWQYDFVAAARRYTARLEGKVEGDHIDWAMYISQEGGWTDVLWFSGQSGLASLIEGNRTGTWTVNYNPEDVTPYLQIDYEVKLLNGEIGQIKYTSIEEGSELEGSYIVHALAEGEPYDRAYNIYIAADDNLSEIEWHALEKYGRRRDPAVFGDDRWHCWDYTLADVDCDDGQTTDDEG